MRLTGFKEMDAVLRELPLATRKRTADRAMKKAIQPVADVANGMLPKGLPPVVVNKKLNKNQAREFRGTESETVRVVHVGSPSPRAHLHEFGSGPRFHKSGKFTGVMPMQPFMRPAWDQTRDQVLEGLRAELAMEIEKAVTRRARRAGV